MILQKLEKRLPNYEMFEEKIRANICSSYFPLLYQSLYSQLEYERLSSRKFTTSQFKTLLIENKFLELINDIYRTRLSEEGLKEISNRLLEVDNYEDYYCALQKFEGCNPAMYKGKIIKKSAFSLGTKLLHYYNPEENPILDTYVRDNLKLDEMDLELCLVFKKAANSFVEKHSDYFSSFYASPLISHELKKRHMTIRFPKMQIIDMALYWPN